MEGEEGMKPPRPSYPRINCSVPGCRRGTTTFEPGTLMICGKCWRKAPQLMRRQYSKARQLWKRCVRRDDPRADYWAWQVDRRWNDILQLLTERSEGDGELPPLLEEELRKAGLA